MIGIASSRNNDALSTRNKTNSQTESCSLESASLDVLPFGVNSVDVILGRGRRIMNHAGNKELKKIVDLHKEKYKKMMKSEKTRLSRDIVDSVRKRGARFLQLNQKNGTYEDVLDYVAREKVSHLLRAKSIQERGKKRKSRAKVKKHKKSPVEDFVDKDYLNNLLSNQKNIFAELTERKVFDVNLELNEIHLEEDASLEEALDNKVAGFDEIFPDGVESMAGNIF